VGEAAEHRPWVAFLAFPDQAEPPHASVDVEDPGELPDASDGLHPHYYEGSEDADWISGRPPRSSGVVASDELLFSNA